MTALKATTSTWNALVCPGKDNADDVESWVNRIAVCLNHQLSSNDLIRASPTVLKDKGVLTNGVIMTASGNENDCLIHSFLTCMSPSFRKCDSNTRNTIASFFRRIILVKKLNDSIIAFNNASNKDKNSIKDSFIIKNNSLEFPDLLKKYINELKTSGMLSTSIAALLATYYNVYIIAIDSQYLFETYIKSVIGGQIDKLIVFYNYSNVHFTPIIFTNNTYVDNSNQYQLRNVPIQMIQELQEKIQTNFVSTVGLVSKNEIEINNLLSSIEKKYNDPSQLNEVDTLYHKVIELLPRVRISLEKSAFKHITNHIDKVKKIIDNTRKQARKASKVSKPSVDPQPQPKPDPKPVPKVPNVPQPEPKPIVPQPEPKPVTPVRQNMRLTTTIHGKTYNYRTITEKRQKGGKRKTRTSKTSKTRKNKKIRIET